MTEFEANRSEATVKKPALLPAVKLEAVPGSLSIKGTATFEIKRIDWVARDNEFLLFVA